MNTEVCTERFIDDIVRIYPIRRGEMANSMPVTLPVDSIEVSKLSRVVNNSLVPFANLAEFAEWIKSKVHFTTDVGTLLGLELQEDATLKITSDRTVSGYQYTLALSMQTTYYHEDERVLIHRLERKGHDYILEREDGSFVLLRYFSPAQKVTHEADGGSATINVQMKNVTGMQDIVESTDESDT